MEKFNIFSMSFIRNRSSDLIENENLPKDNDSNYDLDGDSLSIADTTCSDYSNDVSNLRINELIPNNISNLENIKTPETNIGSAYVANSTNVTIGTVFNGPVAITNFVVDNTKVKRNVTRTCNDHSDQPKAGTEKTSISGQNRLHGFKSNRRLALCFVASAAVLVTAIVIAVYYMYFLYNVPADPAIDNGDYELLDRDQYGALPPKVIDNPLRLPIKRVIISHTATPSCEDYSECASRVRQIQYFHMYSYNWTDIGLNFLVGGDGRAYEGCGYRIGAHTKNYNAVSICIAFIGNFTSDIAPKKQLSAAQKFIDDGVKTNQIHPDYVLYGQRQLRPFDSPGIMLYNEIMSWPHWSKEIIPL